MSTEEGKAEKPEPRLIARFALRSGIVFSLLIIAFVLVFDNEASPYFIKLRTVSGMHPVPPSIAAIAGFVLGMGLGTQWALFWLNRHRIRAVFRPNKGRVISTLVLTFFWPFAQFWGIPFAIGFGLVSASFRLLGGASVTFAEGAMALAVFITVLALCYVQSCLIISGIQRRMVRVALFAQLWLAGYGAVLLIGGFYSGNM